MLMVIGGVLPLFYDPICSKGVVIEKSWFSLPLITTFTNRLQFALGEVVSPPRNGIVPESLSL